MNISISMPDQNIIDILNGAGSRYWCSGLFWKPFDPSLAKDCWEALVKGVISCVVVVEREDDNYGRPTSKRGHKVTRESIQAAFQVIADKYPHDLRGIITGEGDMYSGDTLLQCATFGTCIYG